MANVYQIQNPDTGNPYDVADGPLPGFEKAPDEYAIFAPFWKVSPFMAAPWKAFRIDPVDHNSKMAQFERVTGGPFPTRKQWTDAGGALADFIPGRSRYDQDYNFFGGIIEPPEDLAGPLEAVQPVFLEWLGSRAQCFLFENRRGDADARPTLVFLFFENAVLPPAASKKSGRLRWRFEDATALNLTTHAVTNTISEYQEALIRAGIYVPRLHPAVPLGLQTRNMALKPKA